MATKAPCPPSAVTQTQSATSTLFGPGLRPRANVPVNFGNKRTLAPLTTAGGNAAPTPATIIPARRPGSGSGPAAPQRRTSAPTNADDARVARCATPARGRNLDHILVHLDDSVVPEWLTRSRDALRDLQMWWAGAAGANGTRFAHFWLSTFSDDKRRELLHMEMAMLREELSLALTVAMATDGSERQHAPRTATAPHQDNVHLVLRAVLPEYPDSFGAGDDGTGFLDMARVLAQGPAHPEFRAVLSGVRCSTENTLYAQWLLALRSLVLVTMVTAPVFFFRRFEGLAGAVPASYGTANGAHRPSRPSTSGRPTTAAAARTDDAHVEEAFGAVKMGFPDVLYYLVTRGLVHLDAVDGLGRTLLAVAVAHSRRDVVVFLLENTAAFDINTTAHNGNTALHVAVGADDADLVALLVAAGANPDVANPASGASPRALAKMLDNHRILECFAPSPEPTLGKTRTGP
eukprot:m.121012 g.121012  ORF g.121012 m.121012 type:complete len:462 (+) comp17258_c0_seq1:307-1692(+)